MVKRYPIILIDCSVNTAVVGFHSSTKPTDLTIYNNSKRQENNDKIIAVRSKIQSKFAETAKETESKLTRNLNKFECDFYDKIYVLVNSAKHKEEEIIATSSKTMKKLLSIEKKLEIVRRELAHASR
jgi:predicted choloylglycine hydrolase